MTAAGHDIDALNARYISIVDSQRLEDWAALFAAGASYRITTLENHDRGLPLALLNLSSAGMIRDRVTSLRNNTYFEPYTQRHVLSHALHLQDAQGRHVYETHFLIARTKSRLPSELYCAGRYIDRLVEEEGVLKFLSKICVVDSEIVLNSMALPI